MDCPRYLTRWNLLSNHQEQILNCNSHIINCTSHIASRTSHLASRILHIASRISYLVHCISHLASRISHLIPTTTPPETSAAQVYAPKDSEPKAPDRHQQRNGESSSGKVRPRRQQKSTHQFPSPDLLRQPRQKNAGHIVTYS